ncbi:MAG: radical SAM protein [Bacilli bacterium]|nr:radical SAM protein [Bacilli bacterium]
MKFKKIYIEITNICNLNCSFCSRSNRNKKEISLEDFDTILKKIDDYTDYIYLHVKGEPLIHKELDGIFLLCRKYNKKVCITTNGVFLRDKLDIINKYDNIYQINISLHSENNKDSYLDDIFYSVDMLKYPYISFRFWTLDNGKMDNKTKNYLDRISDKYKKKELYDGIKLSDRIYLSLDDEFDWPSIDNSYYNEIGTCYGGKSHLAILSDGTICICCLDGEGISNLGNIFSDNIEDILLSDKYKNIMKGFNDRKVYLDICKHCSYKNRFNRNNIT